MYGGRGDVYPGRRFCLSAEPALRTLDMLIRCMPWGGLQIEYFQYYNLCKSMALRKLCIKIILDNEKPFTSTGAFM
jgi:hypothetical protein